MLEVLKSREDGFSPLSWRESFHGVNDPVNGEEETHSTALERLETADHGMSLLTSELTKHLHGLAGTNALYALVDHKLFESRAMQQCCFTAPALPLVLVTPADIVAHLLQTERAVMSRAEIVEFDDEKNTVRRQTLSRVELCLENNPSLVYETKEKMAVKVKEEGSENRKLLARMVSISKRRRKTRRRVETRGKAGHGKLNLRKREQRWTKRRKQR